ncbi:MAG: DUF2237 domain-containing protein [Stagnimonas sp.]|nr:DUF2237 domain-containing protein [Stagnimonas sp.]
MNEPPLAAAPTNILGGPLLPCSYAPLTGYFRDGCCKTDDSDQGRHLVCTRMTAEFLAFSVQRGNDLVSPRAEYLFPGLKPGDWWCLCALRWSEALEAGVAPPVRLAATHAAVTRYVSRAALLRHAVDPPEIA